MKRITRVLVVSALAAATLSACTDNGGHDMDNMNSTRTSPGAASSSPSGQSAPGAHNDADVAFATDMIPHHAQAVAMAKMVPTRASSQQVKDLATQIQAAQDPEIKLMSGWLEAWGEPGEGACFRLTLPLVRGHKVTTSPLPMKPIPPPGPQPATPERPAHRPREHADRSG